MVKSMPNFSKIAKFVILAAFVALAIFNIELVGKAIFWILAAIMAVAILRKVAVVIIGLAVFIGAVYLIFQGFTNFF